MSFDLIALGEAMLTLSAPSGGSLEDTRVLEKSHACAESNTCVGAARLGLRTAWISRLGEDPPGRYVRAAVAAEGVDVSWVTVDPDRPTGLMLKDVQAGRVYYYRGQSAATHLSGADLDAVPVSEARAVLVTGVTALISDSAQCAAVSLLERARGLRVVDPNLRDGLWGSARARELVLPLVERADVVLGGEHELHTLFSGGTTFSTGGRPRTTGSTTLGTFARAAGDRPCIVVARRGRDGAVARDLDGSMHSVALDPVPDVDPRGAGDAFNAGYIAATLAGLNLDESLRVAARCGAAVAGQLGDTAGAPDRGAVLLS